MNKPLPRLHLLIALLVLTAAAAAQQPVPTATPDNEVVKISTSLIQVDFTVVDGKGKPISDLRKDEIEIYENGEKQTITNFSFVAGGRPASVEAAASRRSSDGGILIPPPPPITTRPENVRRTIALIVDDLGLSFESVSATRRALRTFVEEQMQPGDMVAIIRSAGGSGTFQQFTSDKQMLRAAIERIKWDARGRGGLSASAPAQETGLEKNFNDSAESFRESTYTTGTLGAIDYVIRGMAEFPGRKSAILFSDGFGMLRKSENGFDDGGRREAMIREIVQRANKSSVVFYAIDMRGVQVITPTADNPAGPSPQQYSAFLRQQSNYLHETQGGPNLLAEGTGGFTFRRNDSASGIRKVLENQSYYLIGYQPDADTFDPKTKQFSKLEIRVKRPGAVVHHRSGFFKRPPVAAASASASASASTPQRELIQALTLPFVVNDIGLSLNPLVGYDPRRGNYVRTLVHIDGRDLKFVDEPGGKSKKLEFSVLGAIFGESGEPVDRLGRSFSISTNESGYRKILDEGVVYNFTFPVEKPGSYQFRFALRDSAGGKLGSASQFVEIPNVPKSNHVVSSIILDGFTSEEWKSAVAGGIPADRDVMGSTALRRFAPEGALRYGYEVYNLKPGSEANISTQIRLFHGDKLVLDGAVLPLDASAKVVDGILRADGAISLAAGMAEGDYILQVIVFDNSAKGAKRVATQAVQFELVR